MTSPPTTTKRTPDSPQQIESLRAGARWAASFCGALLIAGAALIAATSGSIWSRQADYEYAYANAGFVPFLVCATLAAWYAILAIVALSRANAVAGGAAFVTGWGMRITLTALLVRLVVASGFGMYLAYAPLFVAAAVVLFVVFVLLQQPLVRFGRAAVRGRWQDPVAWAGGATPLAFAALGALGFGSVLRAHRRFQQDDAVRLLWQLHSCVYRYAERHVERGFPRSLSELAGDTSCAARRLAPRGPFTLEYRPGGTSPDERMNSYVARAEQRHVWLQRYASLVINETGIVRIAVRRSATLRDHVLAEIAPRMYSGCLRMFRDSYGGYPTDLTLLRKRRCANVENTVAPNTVERHGFRVVYEPVGVFADSLARGYRLHVRPLAYGVTGVRGYFIDESDVLRATGADRAASVHDAEVRKCEFEPIEPWHECW